MRKCNNVTAKSYSSGYAQVNFCICLSYSFRGIRHLRNPMALIKTGPILAIFQNIDKMLPSQR